jgi:hypothetical protein
MRISGRGAAAAPEAVEDEARPVAHGLRRELDLGKAGEQGRERDLALEASQRGAQAEVEAVPEREVRVRRAREVEAVGVGEHGGIAVRRTDGDHHLVAARKAPSRDLHVLERPPRGPLHGAVEAQQLLDGALQQGGLAAQALQLAGMAQQREQAVPQQVAGGLVAGREEQDGGGQDLVVGEAVVALLRAHQPRQQIVLGLDAPSRQQLAHVGLELLDRRHRAREDRRAERPVQDRRRVARPGLETAMVLRRHAQQLADHEHRQQDRELGHPLHLAARAGRCEQLVRKPLDARAQALDHARREGLVHQMTQSGVGGRVEHQHGAQVGAHHGVELLGVERRLLGQHAERQLRGGEARVAQHRGAVGVTAQEPARAFGALEAQRGRLAAHAVIGRVGIRLEDRVGRVERDRHLVSSALPRAARPGC